MPLSTHVCMFRENTRVKGGGGLLFSQPHLQASPGGVAIKLATRLASFPGHAVTAWPGNEATIRQNIEHSRLEHFIVSKTLGKDGVGRSGRTILKIFYPNSQALPHSFLLLAVVLLCELPDHPCRVNYQTTPSLPCELPDHPCL